MKNIQEFMTFAEDFPQQYKYSKVLALFNVLGDEVKIFGTVGTAAKFLNIQWVQLNRAIENKKLIGEWLPIFAKDVNDKSIGWIINESICQLIKKSEFNIEQKQELIDFIYSLRLREAMPERYLPSEEVSTEEENPEDDIKIEWEDEQDQGL